MRSFLPFTIGIIGIIFTLTSFFAIIIPILAFKYHVASTLKLEYDYNNVHLSLLTFLKSYCNNKQIYQLIAERDTNNFEDVREELVKKLSLVTLSECFQLRNSTSVILENNKCEMKRIEERGNIYIIKPEGIIEELILVIKR
ncbi:MAG: hypothetical protein QXD89_01080 [Candidatus Aenigmatarchaeota archaeon]